MDTLNHRTPGQLIQELLDARGWTKRVLAIILGINETALNKIMSGARALDAELALALQDIFVVPAEKFLSLQQSFDLAQAQIMFRHDSGRANRAQLFGNLPVAEMIKRGWIDADDVRDVSQVEAELTKFFGAESPEQIFPHAAKKTKVNGPVTPVQLAWLYRVRQIATELMAARYSPASVEAAIEKLRPLRAAIEDVRKVPRILQDAGIHYLVVESLPGAMIDGVCFWLDEATPVIAMTLRYDRIDNFWFVLRHELEHVLKLDGQDEAMLDAELEGEQAGVGENVPQIERAANTEAAEFCVPDRDMRQFVSRKAPFYHAQDIVGFARTIKVHPGLVAGQLQHRLNRYDRFRQHLSHVRSFILPSAPKDGWGDVYPVGI
ncbi:MAG: HTH-type transcriptional regulator / antitoxin HigA [Verrucomicrobiota bacterium]|jgi:HTH-type transcriptional regulator/antitoxin HigA